LTRLILPDIVPTGGGIAMKGKRLVLSTGVSLLLAAIPIHAHHRLELVYDENRPIILKGTVTKIDWSNPHVRLYIDGKEELGSQMNWNLEMGSPNSLLRTGWKIDTFRRGDHVTVNAYPARDGSSLGYATKVTRTAP
jgi:hypothetical protein